MIKKLIEKIAVKKNNLLSNRMEGLVKILSIYQRKLKPITHTEKGLLTDNQKWT